MATYFGYAQQIRITTDGPDHHRMPHLPALGRGLPVLPAPARRRGRAANLGGPRHVGSLAHFEGTLGTIRGVPT
eukprot:12822159-Prorocentrum_lima.AAC.1